MDGPYASGSLRIPPSAMLAAARRGCRRRRVAGAAAARTGRMEPGLEAARSARPRSAPTGRRVVLVTRAAGPAARSEERTGVWIGGAAARRLGHGATAYCNSRDPFRRS
jgi:hypothetical protein